MELFLGLFTTIYMFLELESLAAEGDVRPLLELPLAEDFLDYS
jgi:hypothetical protein